MSDKVYRCFYPEQGFNHVTEEDGREYLEFEKEDLAVLFDMYQDMILNDECEVIVGHYFGNKQLTCKMRIHRFKRTLTKADYDADTGTVTYEFGFDLTNTISDLSIQELSITKLR